MKKRARAVTDEDDPRDGIPVSLAVKELAGAFAVIEKYHDLGMIPDECYRPICDATHEWVGSGEWMTTPHLAQQIMPILLRAAIIRT